MIAIKRLALVAGLILAGVGFAVTSASAVPLRGLGSAVTQSRGTEAVQNVRYVCGYWGCRWVPGWGYYHPYRRWHRWHRWHHWHRYW